MPRSAIFMTTGAAVALMLLAPAGVSAQEQPVGSPPVVEASIGEPEVNYSRAWGGRRPLPLGTNTREIIIDVGFPSAENGVSCFLLSEDVDYASGYWTREEWSAAGPVRLTVPGGLVVDDDPRRFSVQCSTGVPNGAGFEIVWYLRPAADVGETVTLTDDPTSRTHVRDITFYAELEAPPIAIRPGSLLRIIGPPGTWELPAGALISARLWVWPGDFENPNQHMGPTRLSADRSTVEIEIPTEIRDGLSTGEPILEIVAPIHGNGPRQTIYLHRLSLSPTAVESRTRLALSNTRALSLQRVRATAVISVPGVTDPTGTVTFSVNGRAVRTAELGETSSGRVSIQLPRLPRGTHRITAAYEGGDGISESTGSPVLLRIVV